jgi:hypothetical protein
LQPDREYTRRLDVVVIRSVDPLNSHSNSASGLRFNSQSRPPRIGHTKSSRSCLIEINLHPITHSHMHLIFEESRNITFTRIGSSLPGNTILLGREAHCWLIYDTREPCWFISSQTALTNRSSLLVPVLAKPDDKQLTDPILICQSGTMGSITTANCLRYEMSR